VDKTTFKKPRHRLPETEWATRKSFTKTINATLKAA
jgi:hypothetical protein